PGADVNPYLGFSAMIAAGLDGIEHATDPGPELIGNAYEAAQAEPFPSTLTEAVDLWEGSEFARRAFGEEVWKHYLNYGRTELRLRSAALRGAVLDEAGVPVLRCGAVLRPRSDEEARTVAAIAEGARANGVEVTLRDDGTLEVPGEAVTDPVAYTLALAASAA